MVMLLMMCLGKLCVVVVVVGEGGRENGREFLVCV